MAGTAGNNKDGICLAALICGLISIFIDPLYLVSIAAVVLGVVGLSGAYEKRGMAIAGIILGGASIVVQIILDIIVTIFSGGIGLFSFCC